MLKKISDLPTRRQLDGVLRVLLSRGVCCCPVNQHALKHALNQKEVRVRAPEHFKQG